MLASWAVNEEHTLSALSERELTARRVSHIKRRKKEEGSVISLPNVAATMCEAIRNCSRKLSWTLFFLSLVALSREINVSVFFHVKLSAIKRAGWTLILWGERAKEIKSISTLQEVIIERFLRIPLERLERDKTLTGGIYLIKINFKQRVKEHER